MEDVGRDVLIYLWDNYVQQVKIPSIESFHDILFADSQVHNELSSLVTVLAVNHLLI